MASVWKFTGLWAGFTGSPGYTNVYALGMTDAAAITSFAGSLRTFFNAFISYLPNNSNITVLPSCQEIDQASGDLLTELPISSPPAVVNGASVTAYPGGAGSVVNWRTSTVSAGRVLAGKTYMVPLAGVYESDGTMLAAYLTAARAAAAAFIAAQPGKLAVYRRFRPARVLPTPRTSRDGVAAAVTSAVVNDKAALMRSRRD